MSAITWTLQSLEVSALTDYFKNPRNLTKDQFAQLKKSLDKFGLIDKPIINLDAAHTVIGGHQRLHVLRAEGVEAVECWIPDRELTAKEVEELNIRLNANTGSFDFETIANQWDIESLKDWGLSGETLKDWRTEVSGLDAMLKSSDEPQGEDPGAQIDKAEELRVKWGVEAGQLWKLGEHRLICGDCTDRAVVDRVCDIHPGMMVTDPPYGVDYESEKGAVTNDDRFDWTEAYKLFKGDVAYIWHGERTSLDVGINLRDCGFDIRARIIWVKPSITFGRGNYHFQHEGAWYAVRSNKTGHWCGDQKQSSVWNITREDHEHPTVKPIECMERPIHNHDFDVIYDPFLGSGTTLIACERLSRKCRAAEISPGYVAVAIQRWVDMTGGTPELVTE